MFNLLRNLCSFNSQVRGFNHNLRSLERTFVINAFLSFFLIRNSNSVLSQGWWLAETKSTELCVQLILCFAAEGESLWNIIIYLSVGESDFYLPSLRWITANYSLYLILPFPTRSSSSPLFVWYMFIALFINFLLSFFWMSRKLELCDKLFLEMFKKGRSFLRWKVINYCLLDTPPPSNTMKQHASFNTSYQIMDISPFFPTPLINWPTCLHRQMAIQLVSFV